MSWRGREERSSRWESSRWEGRGRSPVWETRRSLSPERDRDRRSPHRDRHRYEDRRERHERDHRRDRRDRDRKRSPRRYETIPSPPSPPRISYDRKKSRSNSRSNSREKDDNNYDRDRQYDEIQPLSATSPGDWVCKCGVNNFKRRQVCYRRNCNGLRSEGVIINGDDRNTNNETSGITKRLLFRRLDALTTEEKILEAVKDRCTKTVLDSIAGITIGRETLTGASKCLAYINFNSISDSTAAYTEMINLQPTLEIDGREVLISYYNEPKKKQNTPDYTAAGYRLYSQSNYNINSSQAMSEADRVNAAAAVAQSAINAAQARSSSWVPTNVPTFGAMSAQITSTTKIPTGDGKTVYSPPDVRTFMYDETSGYYFDPATSLYYDGSTQYFYNSHTNQYMYWDGQSSSYVAAPHVKPATEDTTNQNPAPTTETRKEPEKKKEDKVKVAKKIAKDMERWAKTLNQKKENARSNIVMEQVLDTSASKGSADIGFSVLGGSGPSVTHVREISPPPPNEEFLTKKVESIDDIDEGIIDWSKLTCLLCKRKFPSMDVLTKHKTISDLHKQNLEEFRKKNDLLPQLNGYRDRAAERRLKFGEDDAPIVRKRYDQASYESEVPGPPTMSHPPPSVVDTIGGKMLQKMGWSEGKGLGKTEQGRTAPVEAHQRPSLVGLGQKRGIYTPTPGETYRDTVKKLMIARYKEVVGQEDGN